MFLQDSLLNGDRFLGIHTFASSSKNICPSKVLQVRWFNDIFLCISLCGIRLIKHYFPWVNIKNTVNFLKSIPESVLDATGFR